MEEKWRDINSDGCGQNQADLLEDKPQKDNFINPKYHADLANEETLQS